MPRPKRYRKMQTPPLMNGFRPFGVPARAAESVVLLFEEYEALRLADYENLNQEEAAELMKVSRPTFARIYDKARKTIAKAFVEGKAIFIEGGNVAFGKDWYRCQKCNHTFVSGSEHEHDCPKCDGAYVIHINETLNQGAKKHLQASELRVLSQECNEAKTCMCVNCGDLELENVTEPCRLVNCPKCGQPLIRKDSYQYHLLKDNGII